MLPELFHSIPKSAFSTLKLRKGEFLFHQNDETRGLFYLVRGKIELRRVAESGELVIVHRALEGETFAEASLFTDAYHCDAISTIEGEIIELERNYVLTHLRGDPEFAIAIATHLAKQNQLYRRKLEIMAIKNACDRVYSALSEGMLKSDVISLAAEIGLTHEAVYRSLKKLTDQGRIIKTGRGKYTINSAEPA